MIKTLKNKNGSKQRTVTTPTKKKVGNVKPLSKKAEVQDIKKKGKTVKHA